VPNPALNRVRFVVWNHRTPILLRVGSIGERCRTRSLPAVLGRVEERGKGRWATVTGIRTASMRAPFLADRVYATTTTAPVRAPSAMLTRKRPRVPVPALAPTLRCAISAPARVCTSTVSCASKTLALPRTIRGVVTRFGRMAVEEVDSRPEQCGCDETEARRGLSAQGGEARESELGGTVGAAQHPLLGRLLAGRFVRPRALRLELMVPWHQIHTLRPLDAPHSIRARPGTRLEQGLLDQFEYAEFGHLSAPPI
jgi:hypothetical protein